MEDIPKLKEPLKKLLFSFTLHAFLPRVQPRDSFSMCVDLHIASHGKILRLIQKLLPQLYKGQTKAGWPGLHNFWKVLFPSIIPEINLSFKSAHDILKTAQIEE